MYFDEYWSHTQDFEDVIRRTFIPFGARRLQTWQLCENFETRKIDMFRKWSRDPPCFCFEVLLISDQFKSLHFNNLNRVAGNISLLNVKYLWLASEEQNNPL